MSVDLSPRKPIKAYHSGSFSWSWMLREGVGAPIGHMELDGLRYFAMRKEVRRRGGVYFTDAFANDGFPVSGPESKAMARAAWGLAERERYRWKLWRALPEPERARREALVGLRTATPWEDWSPVREDFIDRAEEFAWFAFASGGFRVY